MFGGGGVLVTMSPFAAQVLRDAFRSSRPRQQERPSAGGLCKLELVAVVVDDAHLPDRAKSGDVTDWPDAWLVAAARREPPDVQALDALVHRYWKLLFGRCQLLTLDRDMASDLAQETWVRVLRARTTLDPDRSFPVYLVTIATNLWRDRLRAERRAGALADRQVASLDAPPPGESADGFLLSDVVRDSNALPVDEQVLRALDVDRALARLTPRARDVLTARYLDGESAAEIGRRYGRTEQTISAWVREASQAMRLYLGESWRDIGLRRER